MDLKATLKELEGIDKKIREAESEKQRLKGSLETVISGWKQRFNVSNFTEAKAKHTEIENEIKEKSEKLRIMMIELDEAHEW